MLCYRHNRNSPHNNNHENEMLIDLAWGQAYQIQTVPKTQMFHDKRWISTMSLNLYSHEPVLIDSQNDLNWKSNNTVITFSLTMLRFPLKRCLSNLWINVDNYSDTAKRRHLNCHWMANRFDELFLKRRMLRGCLPLLLNTTFIQLYHFMNEPFHPFLVSFVTRGRFCILKCRIFAWQMLSRKG